MPRRITGDIGFVLMAAVVTVLLCAMYIIDYNNEANKVSSETVKSNSTPTPSRSIESSRSGERKAPVVSVTAEPTPPPNPKPEPTAEAEPEQEPETKPEPKPKPTTATIVSAGQTIPHDELPYIMQIIDDHESGDGPEQYRAYNPTGCSDDNGTWSCGGRWQLSQQYASGWAANAGFPGQSSNAETWDPAIQDAVALDLFEKTGGSLWCNYTDYC